MVEVFKTNVTSNHQARVIVALVQARFEGYKVNFDLEDCDHILRIESIRIIETDPLIDLLKDIGVKAEVLSDEVEDIAFLTH